MTRFEVCLMVCAILSTPGPAHAQHADTTLGAAGKTWRFAVSGDSRNCGDVVMPAIAKKARADGVAFYWHLGDFRAIYDFDQDYRQIHPKANILAYETASWPDFIEHQLLPFGDLPVYLSFGNHEAIPPKTRTDALLQFADWFNTPELKTQRLRDDPNAHLLRSYYHWIKAGVDFITLDNASDDQFDEDQLAWFSGVIDRAAKAPEIRTVVVGMHRALPDSLSSGHSMNDSAAGIVSGRAVYKQLVDFRSQTNKNVYVLASHSHFFLDNLYNTACRREHPDSILPGWIVGTAGAVRHRLPADTNRSQEAKADIYGYLVGDVASDGKIQFQFRPISETDVPAETRQAFTPDFVAQCFAGNSSPYVPDGPAQPPNCP